MGRYVKKELIEFFAKELIDKLGIRNSYESIEYDGTEPTYCGNYTSGYGINISATYKDSSYTDFDSLEIEFKGRTVYSERAGIYIEGSWQDVLEMLYKKIPTFLEQREEADKKIKHADDLYKYFIKPIYKNRLKINDSLMFYSYEEHNPYHGYGDSTTYHHTVKKDDEIVLDVIDYIYDYSIDKYVPGAWEMEIIDFYKSYTTTETEEEHNEAIKQFKKLRDLK